MKFHLSNGNVPRCPVIVNSVWCLSNYSIAVSRRRKPPSRKICCKPKNRRKIYGLAEKPLTIILRLAAEKLYRFNICYTTGTNRDSSGTHGTKTVINKIKGNKSVIIN